jgi:CMP-N-acetylneuraminic acid synthetase
MLQPTSPGRDLEEFKEAMLRHSNTLNPLTSSIWSVVPVPHQFHAHKQIVALPNLYLNRENVKPPRRQNLPPSYVRNGDFYILGRHVLDDPYLAGKQLDVFQSKYPAINIDTAEDFRNAERLLTAEGLSLAKREEKF